METIIRKIKEIQTGQVGILVYSTKNGNIVATHNNEL